MSLRAGSGSSAEGWAATSLQSPTEGPRPGAPGPARQAPEADVAVVGAGPAGSIVALILARAGFRVRLVEASLYEETRPGETLSSRTTPLLRQLGLLPVVMALEPLPSYGIRSAWGGEELETSSFVFSPYGQGWHIDRERLDRAFAEAAQSAGADLMLGCTVTDCVARGDGGWCLEASTRDGGNWRFEALAVVDATGRKAALARWLGAWRDVRDHLVGIGCELPCSVEPQNYAVIEACKDGWWYVAPLAHGRRVVMLMTDADLSASRDLTSSEGFAAALALTRHTAAHCGSPIAVARPRPFSAVSQRLRRRACNGRWVAAGDAVLAVDPLSGSGFVRALESAGRAAEAVAGWLRGEPAAAVGYERWLDGSFDAYLQEREAVYAREQRWLSEPFWDRRLGQSSML